MKNKLFPICMFFLFLGCTYNVNTRSPNVKIQIIDDDTLHPVSGAAVYCSERPDVIAISDLEGIGRISRRRERIRLFPFGPWNVTPPDCTLTIKATGYETVVFERVRSLYVDKGIFYLRKNN